ncbi:hypothetical protein BD310DRAFT_975436 [Dichomitus squalens]|uniref:Uncharacterized protein n=1 Tax=Dichomitus squalens TaxID=114155 RepID=A0A4V2K8Q8_9APHY|nr:hypothetical protein BD310DRAFT_975436 [Dichomitus squalens]
MEKTGPMPRPSSKAWGKKWKTMVEQEEQLKAEQKKREFKRKKKKFRRKKKEIDADTAPIEADLPFSQHAWREITVLKILRYAMSEIQQFREEMEELRHKMRLTCGAISNLA